MKTIKTLSVFGGLFVGVAAALSGCAAALHEDENGIIIEHATRQAGVAQMQADSHCEKFGKKAVLVQKSPKQTNYLLESNVSEFECVP